MGEFSLAGAVAETSGLGRWWSAVPKDRWPQNPDWRELVRSQWDPTFGDRRQELVFIGTGLDREAITAALDACLLPDAAFEPRAWARLPDPFPAWGTAA